MPITRYNSSVRQMSQSKFESMKNASGKIPDLANQIVMTNSEDTNNNCLRTEVVYDMTSSNASKNWGYPNGIKNNVTVTGKDFSKYDKLIAYCYTEYYIYPVEIDLTKSTVENFYISRLCIGKAESMLYFAGGQTNLEKTSFTARIFRVNPETDMNTEYDNNSFHVYKIEGVLKEPSMIYTGDELFAGNGINIANGVIGIKQAQSVALNTTRTGQNDTVVEYYVSSDGNTWYRKWDSGWKECGMEITYSGSINANSMQYVTPSLPITFSNASYTIQLTGLYGGTASGKVIWTVEKPTVNNFMAGVMGVGISVTNPKCKIYCCGY